MKKFILSVLLIMIVAGLAVADDENFDFNATLKLAENGDAEAQNRIGVAYNNGEGVEQNYSEAMKWYLKSAEQNYPYAFDNLGSMYQNGLGVE
ncbi:MAG: sel1 repeat family protein, partial [Synergistaceae bacterium]|nr:sel1 repeat family protein [Synergistaceae bacterium]MBR0232820.1 sel1 repeat family protein [Synergistaceae bacterium]